MQKDLKNLYEVYAARTAERQEALCFDNKYSYNQVWNMAKNRARFLLAQGIGRGDVVGLLSVNGWEWCVTYMAITSIGAIALQMDTNLNLETWQKMLERAEAKTLIVSRDFQDLVWQNVRILDIHAAWSDAPVDLPNPQTDMQSPASLLFTSGTTSDPKIVMLTHGNVYYTARSLVDYFLELKPGFVTGFETVLCILPLYHVYGMQANFFAIYILGAHMIFQNSLKGPDLIKSLAENPINVFCGVPQLWELFFDNIVAKVKAQSKLKYLLFMTVLDSADIWGKIPGLNKILRKVFAPVHKVIGTQMKFFISGGASLKMKYFKRYTAMGFRILEGYGLTETTGPALVSNPLLPNPGSVGWCVRGNEIDLRNVKADGIGEIWMRGVSVMPGYYKNPDATQEAFDADGWFNTGDLGFQDKIGALHITGRSKNVIVLDSGKNVYPEELEDFYKNSALIEELAVFGYKVNGVETVYAVIVPTEKTPDSYQKIKAEIERLNKGLPSYKIISAFAVSFTPLPRNSIKKLVMREIIKELERGKYQKESALQLAERAPYQPADEQQKKVLRILSERLNSDKLYAEQTTLELEIDSLKFLDIAAQLEQALGVAINIDELSLKQNLQEIVEYIAACQPADKQAEDPLTGELEYKIRPSGNPLLSFYTWLSGVISRRRWGLTIKNAELYQTENCIFAPNHQSYLDIIWIWATMPKEVRRRTYLLAKKELSFWSWLLGGRLPVIYVDRHGRAMSSLKAGADVLRQGVSLVVFPEGMRSYDGQPGEFKIGAALLAKKLGKKIVPVAIKGAYEIYPRQKLFPNFFAKQRGEVALCAPLNPDDYATPEELNNKLKEVIIDAQKS